MSELINSEAGMIDQRIDEITADAEFILAVVHLMRLRDTTKPRELFALVDGIRQKSERLADTCSILLKTLEQEKEKEIHENLISR